MMEKSINNKRMKISSFQISAACALLALFAFGWNASALADDETPGSWQLPDSAPAPGVTAVELTTEMSVNPLGLDTRVPRLSWKMEPLDGIRGQRQTAYRILVATAPALLKEGSADVCDSKQVSSDQSVLVNWDCGKLKPKSRYYWTVKVWDEKQQAGGYASAAWFETGIFEATDWFSEGAKWIESPLKPVVDEAFEHWARFAIFTLKGDPKGGSMNLGSSFKPTEVDIQKLFEHERAHLKDRVWSASMMRREFQSGRVRQARLYICGLGYYRAYLNGKMIGDRVLTPSDSHFFAHAYFNVYDVSELVKAGQNCLAVELANGRWRAWPGNTPETYSDRPVLLARLEITDEEGQTRTIVTDGNWQCGQHPVRRSGFWIGELYDARAFPDGWTTSGFQAESWVAASEAEAGAKIQALTRDPMPPEKMGEPIPPKTQTEPKPKVFVYDFGQMVGGRARFVFRGLKAGQKVVVRYAEAIDDRPFDALHALAYYETFDNVTQQAAMLKFKSRGSLAKEGVFQVVDSSGQSVKHEASGGTGGTMAYTDLFVSAGKEVEVWTPCFTYTGFRYLEILGLKEPLPMADVAAFNLRTHPEIIGSLTTDNAKLNRILKGVQDTLLLCFHSQLQDNNGAERNPNAGNLAQNDLNLAYWLNAYPLWLKGAKDTVKIDTLFGWPVNMICGMRDVGAKKKRELNISNSLHYGHLPWDLLAFYNDRQSAASLLPWNVRFVKETSEHTVWESLHGSADHIATSALAGFPDKGRAWVKDDRLTDPQFVKAGFIIRIARLGIQVAEELHRTDEVQELKALLTAFESRVEKTWFDQAKREWTPDYPTIQGRNLTLMYFMMQPRRDDRDLCAEIVREIRDVTGGHQITGSRLSYPLLHELSQNGFQDEAMRLLMRDEYPSLLEMIQQTGNTIRESWGTWHSFAQIEGLTEMGKWFYTDLVGIAPSIKQPAFASFSLKPIVPDGVGSYDFSYNSPRGIIKSSWKESQGKVNWKVVVPPNSSAMIHIPANSDAPVLEAGMEVRNQKSIHFDGAADGWQIYKIESGSFTFTFPARKKQMTKSVTCQRAAPQVPRPSAMSAGDDPYRLEN